jgi:pimeloyl-ACP methyl ester carboxylesterase
MVKRRHVFHLAGYDAIGIGWYRLFKRELQKFCGTWNVASTVSDIAPAEAGRNPVWTVTTTAPNWFVETSYEPLLWDDIILSDFARPMRQRLSQAFRVFFDIVISGTFFRYCKANWQYGLFFLFPFVLLALFALVAVSIAYQAMALAGLSGWLQAGLGAAIAIGLFITLLRWPGRRWRVRQSLDDWIFSWQYVHGRRPDLDQRTQSFAERLLARVRDPALDEILLVGHSMGATLALEIITRALERDPDLGRHGPSVCLLTVGSTIPKFTLHPAGKRFGEHATGIVREPSIAWAEYHARSDPISFYKFDPVRLTPFYGDPMRGKPLMRRIRLQHMLQAHTYWRFRLRFMRLHYQVVMANERRATYDYFMMVCGPIPFARTVLTRGGSAELIAPDGSLIDPDAPTPAMPAPEN